MIKKCVTAEDMRKLEADISYFYNHGGPVMDEGVPYGSECAMTENSTPTRASIKNTSKPAFTHKDTKWRNSIQEGDLEAEIAYFYNHGGPIME